MDLNKIMPKFKNKIIYQCKCLKAPDKYGPQQNYAKI